jgi:ATP-binding cassette, subfamily D (ALD), member 3
LHHAEEIAFYRGHEWEKKRVNESFDQLIKHSSGVIGKKLFMGCFDNFLVKYGAVLIGFAILGLPVFGPGSEEYLKKVGNDASLITKDYIRNSSLLINLAKAIGRLVVSYKEVQNLAGYTTLVYQVHEVISDLENSKSFSTC